MNLYYIYQNEVRGYDTYDSAVVAAPDEETARRLHPNGCGLHGADWGESMYSSSAWPRNPEHVTAELIGVAVEGTEQGVIVSSFNAG